MKKGVSATVVVIIAVVLFAAGFGAGLFAAPAFFPGPQQLRLGTVLGKTGGLAAFGTRNEQGARLAIEQVNDQGGVFGQPIVVFHEDSRTLPDAAREAAEKLVTTNRVHGIIGATGSGQCLTVIAVTKANEVFQMSGSCTSVLLSDPDLDDGWFARTAPSDALQGVVAGYYAQEVLEFTNMAVIGINNPYGTGLADVFQTAFEFYGGTITIKHTVTEVGQGATTYVPDLNTVLNTGPQAVYLVAYPDDGVLMMQEYFTGTFPEVTWLFSEGLFEQGAFITELATRGVDVSGFRGTAPGAYGGITGPRYDAWAVDYEDRWGQAPFLFDANVYDSTFLMALAAQASGQASGAGIKSKIHDVANPPGTVILPGEWSKALTELAAGRDINYQGASGAVDLDDVGDPVISDYVIWGVNETNKAYNIRVFDEDEVAALVEGLQASPAMQVVRANSFVVDWIAPFHET